MNKHFLRKLIWWRFWAGQWSKYNSIGLKNLEHLLLSCDNLKKTVLIKDCFINKSQTLTIITPRRYSLNYFRHLLFPFYRIMLNFRMLLRSIEGQTIAKYFFKNTWTIRYCWCDWPGFALIIILFPSRY